MNNPLLTDDLLPKFDHVRTEHMEPAIDQILSENRVKISQLAQQDEPTWETLAQPMQATEDRLERAWSVISHLNGVMNSDDLRKVYKNCLEKLTEYSTELSQNADLCEAYKKLAASDQYNELSEAQRKSVDNTLRDFHLGGVDPTEMEVPQGVVHGFTLCLAEFVVLVACCQFFIRFAEISILTQLGAVLGELFQAVLVHLAQVITVHHTIQVGDDRPGSFQAVLGCLHRLRQGFPGGFVLLRQL